MINYILLLLTYLNLDLFYYNKYDFINFVIWKGYNKANIDYINFSNILIKHGKKHNINFNVTISDNYDLNEIKYNTILFGHSYGGFKCLEYNNSKLIAKIVYGATHNTYKKIKHVSKIDKDNIPTLTMIGNKDGIFSPSHLNDEIYDNYIFKKKNQHTILVNNTNHLCICNNKVSYLSKFLGIKDNNLDIDPNLMINAISNIIIYYIKFIL